MNALLAHVTGTGLDDWLIVIVPLAAIGLIIAALARPNGGRSVFARISDRMERLTGMPGWAASTLGVGLGGLLIAAIGFYWDVAWHIDLGRDKELFTPAHDMILLGLMFIPFAAGTAIVLATAAKAETKLRLGELRVPWSSLALGAIGLGALTGFPLDEVWHRAYGIDVTMWGPTHLMMIGGASITPIGLWLVFRESGVTLAKGTFARRIAIVLAGATMTGLSTFQGEFDFGVPQFQALYHPVLVVAAAAGGLTLARLVLGRGGAIHAILGFLAIRGGIALLVGGFLGHTFPRFPLYIGAAIAVELVAWILGTAKVGASRSRPASPARPSGLRPSGAGRTCGAPTRGTVTCFPTHRSSRSWPGSRRRCWRRRSARSRSAIGSSPSPAPIPAAWAPERWPSRSSRLQWRSHFRSSGPLRKTSRPTSRSCLRVPATRSSK